MLNDFCSFVESIWGGSHKIITDLIGLKVLEIQNGHDMFHISLADKERFGKFSLYHRNYGKFLNGSYGWHLQCKCWTLSYAIVQAYGHSFHKDNDLWLNKEDYDRLMADWRKYCE